MTEPEASAGTYEDLMDALATLECECQREVLDLTTGFLAAHGSELPEEARRYAASLVEGYGGEDALVPELPSRLTPEEVRAVKTYETFTRWVITRRSAFVEEYRALVEWYAATHWAGLSKTQKRVLRELPGLVSGRFWEAMPPHVLRDLTKGARHF